MKHLVIVFAVLVITNPSHGMDEINWLIINVPPIMILEDGQVKGGRTGKLLEILQEDLTGYQHNLIEMRWARFWHELKQGNHICNPMTLKTADRMAKAEFSAPFAIALPRSIVMEEKTVKRLKLDPEKPLSLKEIMFRDDLSGLLEISASYTPFIDQILAEHEKGSNIERKTLTPYSRVGMLLRGRVDYIINYPCVAAYVRGQMSEIDGNLVFFSIKGLTPFSFSYIACPKNDWGKKVISDINHALERVKPLKEYRDAMNITATTPRERQVIQDAYPAFLAEKE